MNKKIIFLVGIVMVLAVASFVMYSRLRPTINNQIGKQNSQSNDMTNPEIKKRAITITYSDNVITPANINAKNGDYLLISNITNDDVTIGLSGAINSQVVVKARGIAPSPLLTQNGTVKVFNTKNTSISAKITITGESNTSSNSKDSQEGIKDLVNGAVKKAAYKEIQVTDSGFQPSTVTIKKDELVHFINKTKKTVEIISTGKNSLVVAQIAAGETGISLPLTQAGEYNFALKDNAGTKGSVLVQ